jgi:hypothetical protein
VTPDRKERSTSPPPPPPSLETPPLVLDSVSDRAALCTQDVDVDDERDDVAREKDAPPLNTPATLPLPLPLSLPFALRSVFDFNFDFESVFEFRATSFDFESVFEFRATSVATLRFLRFGTGASAHVIVTVTVVLASSND